ncbi:hypothetical protein DXU06_14020 [Bradyrhizobium elkanii]|nr:hypothetical protein [Bradyrhizobium elkanii]RYM22410.1 hypothetical protein EWH13_24930 [Bradyrhizobium elkanii]
MPGLVPGIQVFVSTRRQDVDGRDKPGHDGAEESVHSICDCPARKREREATQSRCGPLQTSPVNALIRLALPCLRHTIRVTPPRCGDRVGAGPHRWQRSRGDGIALSV